MSDTLEEQTSEKGTPRKRRPQGAITLVPRGDIAQRIRTIASAIHIAQKTQRHLEILWLVNEAFPCPSERLFTIRPEVMQEGVAVEMRQASWKDYILNMPPDRSNLYISWPFVTFRYDRTISQRGFERYLRASRDEVETLFKDSSEYLLLSTNQPLGSFPHMYNALEATVEVNNVLKSRMSGWAGKVVGVHINRMVEEGNKEDCPTELILRRMQKMIEEDPEVHFFVATHSYDERERIAALFKDRVYVPYSTQDLQSQKGMVETFGELLALSHTRYIISTKGSPFSVVAAEIGGVQLEILSVFAQSDIIRY